LIGFYPPIKIVLVAFNRAIKHSLKSIEG